MYRNDGENRFFHALEQDSSQIEYGNVLGRFVCFYLRILRVNLESESDSESGFNEPTLWSEMYQLSERQKDKLEELNDVLNDKNTTKKEMDIAFHACIKEMFCRQESRKLLDEMACPVQRFLVVLCLRKTGNGFINVREITTIIAKLLYSIRATVFMELLRKEEGDIEINKELGGLRIYVQDLVQSPFGLLRETMHLAATIAGDTSSLPQISWLGDDDYLSLAIHGKRVEL